MKLVDLSNPRHQQILIEEIARAKRIIAEDGDDNNNGYPDATENPASVDDGMFVTKGFTELNISAEDIDTFLAGNSVVAVDSDGEEYEINRDMEDINWSAGEKKTWTGQEILSHPEFAKLPETRSDVDWKNRAQVYLPSLGTADARTQIFAKSDLLGSEVQGPKMLHKFSGYLKEFESKFNEAPIFIDTENKYLGKVIDIQNPKFQEWRNRGLAAKGDYMDSAKNVVTTDMINLVLTIYFHIIK